MELANLESLIRVLIEFGLIIAGLITLLERVESLADYTRSNSDAIDHNSELLKRLERLLKNLQDRECPLVDPESDKNCPTKGNID